MTVPFAHVTIAFAGPGRLTAAALMAACALWWFAYMCLTDDKDTS